MILAVTATLVVAGLGVWSGKADEKKSEPTSVESPASKSSEATTNAFRPKEGGLKQLEQDLFKPFERTSPKGSLDGAFIPEMPQPHATTPAIQSKRAKELLARKRDWAFETPEEILATPGTEDILSERGKGKDNTDKSNLSPLERFYERLYKKDKNEGTSKENKREGLYDSRKTGVLGDDSVGDDADLPLGVQETQREMRKLLAPKERKADASPEPSGSFFADVFGLGKSTVSREDLEMQKERMDRYKALVGLPVRPALENDPLKPFRDIIGTAPKNGNLFPTMDTASGLPQQNLFGTQAGSASTTPNNSLLPDGARIYTPPSLAPALPKIEPPKSLPPPVTFSTPRRAF